MLEEESVSSPEFQSVSPFNQNKLRKKSYGCCTVDEEMTEEEQESEISYGGIEV